MKGKKFAYARVSSKEQNLDRQIEALKPYIDDERDLITDKASGKNLEREGWKLLDYLLREGDELTVTSLDRISRNYNDLKDIWQMLTNKKVKIRVLDMPLVSTADKEDDDLTAKLIADITISLLAYVAETERNHIKERQRQGIETAKKNGKHLGRPKYIKPNDYENIMEAHASGEITAVEAARRLKISRAKFYQLKNERTD